MVNHTILPNVAENLILNLTRTIAALGGIIFLYLIFQSIIVYLNRKKAKSLEKIEQKLSRIEKLLEKTIKK